MYSKIHNNNNDNNCGTEWSQRNGSVTDEKRGQKGYK